jgi:hypothetical protein
MDIKIFLFYGIGGLLAIVLIGFGAILHEKINLFTTRNYLKLVF